MLFSSGQCDIFNHTFRTNIAKHRDFFKDRLFQRLITAQHNDVRIDPHALQLFDRVLCGFGFVLVRSAQKRYQSHMDKQTIFATDFQINWAHRLQKTADFQYHRWYRRSP